MLLIFYARNLFKNKMLNVLIFIDEWARICDNFVVFNDKILSN